MLNTIILIRHGESEKDKSNPNRKLTKNGLTQAVKVSRDLKKIIRNSDATIIASKPLRTVLFAKILSARLKIPMKVSVLKLGVKNITTLRSKGKVSPTLTYINLFEKGQLPSKIPKPRNVIKLFSDEIDKVNSKCLIIVGHGGALEIFGKYQKTFLLKKSITKDLKYAEFIVLKRRR